MAHLLQDIWSKFRPYLEHFVVDALISFTLWVVFWSFKLLTKLLPINSWGGEWIKEIHSAGAVISFIVFACLFVIDIYQIHQKERG